MLPCFRLFSSILLYHILSAVDFPAAAAEAFEPFYSSETIPLAGNRFDLILITPMGAIGALNTLDRLG